MDKRAQKTGSDTEAVVDGERKIHSVVNHVHILQDRVLSGGVEEAMLCGVWRCARFQESGVSCCLLL